ncbi:MAG: nucleotidyltransferase domain-containing protein [Candidatus Methylomirabilia bacterium]
MERFLRHLLDRRGEELEFVVLFGSMARGDWSRGSDYDIFVGLRGEDEKRLIDRMFEFSPLVETERVGFGKGFLHELAWHPCSP